MLVDPRVLSDLELTLMTLDLRLWPVRTAPICADGVRRAFQIRRQLLMAHRGEWDVAAEWVPVWISFGTTWQSGGEPLPWHAHRTLWQVLDAYAAPRPLPATARRGASPTAPVRRGATALAGSERLGHQPLVDGHGPFVGLEQPRLVLGGRGRWIV